MEEYIDWKRMIWNIIFKWRILIISVILCACAFATYQYRKDMSTYQQLEAEQQKNSDVSFLDELREGFTTNELNDITELTTVKNAIANGQAYINNAVDMSIDPYCENVYRLQYYIKTNSSDSISTVDKNDIALLFLNQFNSDELKNSVAVAMNLDIETINQCFVVSSAETGAIINIDIIVDKVHDFDVMDLVNCLETEMENCQDSFGNIEEYQITLASSGYITLNDIKLAEKQNKIINNLLLLQEAAHNLEDNMSDEQLQYINLSRDLENIESLNINNIAKPSISAKNAVIGGIGGLLLICLFFFLKSFFSTRLQVVDKMSECYGVKIFGKISVFPKRKICYFIDRKLVMLYKGNEKKIFFKQQLNIISAGIIMTCKKKGIKMICLTGSYDFMKENYLQEIIAQIQDGGIKVTVVQNICYDIDALKTCVDSANVILVEREEKSICSEIEKEIAKAKEYSVEILGSIVASPV